MIFISEFDHEEHEISVFFEKFILKTFFNEKTAIQNLKKLILFSSFNHIT